MLIKNAHIFIGNGEELNPGSVRIEDGFICEIAESLTAKPGEEVIDAKGKVLLPGLIDAHSHIGGMDFSYDRELDDLNEMTNPMSAAPIAFYSINPLAKDFASCRRMGITTLMVCPGSGSLFNGIASIIKTSGDNLAEMLVREKAACKIALGGNPISTYGSRSQAPSTRMSIPPMAKAFFSKAREYFEKKEKGEKVDYNVDFEATLAVFRGEMPLKIHCTQYDIPTAIELAQFVGAAFSLEHVWGASDYLEEIIEAKPYICFGPMGSLTTPGEARKIDPEALIALDQAGVCCSIISDSPIIAVDSLIQHAGEAVRQGLDYRRAIVMLTLNPAIILGIDDCVGSIEVGKEADLALFSGIPCLEVAARVEKTWQKGKLVYEA